MMYACVHSHVFEHIAHQNATATTNGMSSAGIQDAFPDPSFVQCNPRLASLASSGFVAGGGGTVEQCAQQIQESEVTRLVSKVQTCFCLCCLCSKTISILQFCWRRRRKRRHPALHGHANTSTCTRKHKHMHTYTPMHAYIYIYIYICVCVHAHMCAYANSRSRMHTHTQTSDVYRCTHARRFVRIRLCACMIDSKTATLALMRTCRCIMYVHACKHLYPYEIQFALFARPSVRRQIRAMAPDTLIPSMHGSNQLITN